MSKNLRLKVCFLIIYEYLWFFTKYHQFFSEPPEEEIEGPVQCYRCAEMFESVKLVKEHLTSKHGICRKSHFGKERVHQCHACKFMFENEEKKNSHYCRYTLNENPEWGKNYCKICDLKFPSRDQLLQHHRSYHVTEEKHKCDQCDFKVILNNSFNSTMLENLEQRKGPNKC